MHMWHANNNVERKCNQSITNEISVDRDKNKKKNLKMQVNWPLERKPKWHNFVMASLVKALAKERVWHQKIERTVRLEYGRLGALDRQQNGKMRSINGRLERFKKDVSPRAPFGLENHLTPSKCATHTHTPKRPAHMWTLLVQCYHNRGITHTLTASRNLSSNMHWAIVWDTDSLSVTAREIRCRVVEGSEHRDCLSTLATNSNERERESVRLIVIGRNWTLKWLANAMECTVWWIANWMMMHQIGWISLVATLAVLIQCWSIGGKMATMLTGEIRVSSWIALDQKSGLNDKVMHTDCLHHVANWR